MPRLKSGGVVEALIPEVKGGIVAKAGKKCPEIVRRHGLLQCPCHSKPKVLTNGEFSMRVAMIGAGYVGLVSGACFADFGHEVCCVDKDPGKIEALNRGEIPIFEPGLDDLVAKNVREDRLTFTTDLSQAVRNAEAVFIAVGTPSRRGDGHADLSYVYQAARDIAAAMDGYTVVVTKSTVPVGTGDEVERIIRETRILNSCAKARPSPISSARTASSSAPRTSAPRA
jgi:threonine dehydrogenase-like Zn-dependent dehydrogenase